MIQNAYGGSYNVATLGHRPCTSTAPAGAAHATAADHGLAPGHVRIAFSGDRFFRDGAVRYSAWRVPGAAREIAPESVFSGSCPARADD